MSKQDVTRVGALLATTTLGLVWLFWPQVSTGFAVFTSDRFDGLIAAALYEHWHNVFTGRAEAWDNVFWFHPWSNTLAMNDGYILHGVLHTILRTAGLPPLLAVDITGMVLQATIAPAAYLIARRHLSLSFGASLFGAFLVLIASNLTTGAAYHAQFFAAGPALFCALLVLEAGAALRTSRHTRTIAFGVAASLLFGLLLMTSFYVTYTLVLFLLLGFLGNLALRALMQAPVLPERGWLLTIFPVFLVAVLAALPALQLYLPQMKTGPERQLSQASENAMLPYGLLDPGLQSPLWSWAGFSPGTTPDGPQGYGPLVLVALILGTATALRQALRPGPDQPAARLVATAGLTSIFLLVLITSWSGFWGWAVVWAYLPGAKAFRAVSRVSMLIAPAVMLVAAWWVMFLRPCFGHVISVLVGFLLLGEQLSPRLWGANRHVEEGRLAAISAPPADCRVFAATRPREGVMTHRILGLYSHNVDAMLTASLLRLPTINGFSTINPPGWDLGYPNERLYSERVYAEARRHGLMPCGLDFETLRWSSTGHPFQGVPVAPVNFQLIPDVQIQVRPDTPHIRDAIGPGWSDFEATGIWTDGPRAILVLSLPEGTFGGTLRLDGRGFSRTSSSQRVRAILPSGVALESDIAVNGGTVNIPFRDTDLLNNQIKVVLEIAEPASPASPEQPGDHRMLGFFLNGLELSRD